MKDVAAGFELLQTFRSLLQNLICFALNIKPEAL